MFLKSTYFSASLTIDREQPEYDVDSEDEQWLSERGHLSADNFERMMELLEGASSDVQICQPKEARSLLKDFEDDLIDDVYDYWLQKRKVCVLVSCFKRGYYNIRYV